MDASVLAAAVLLAVPVFTEATANLGTQPACTTTGCWTNYDLLADLDGDGDLDILFPNANGFFSQGPAEPLVVLINDGSGTFSDDSAQLNHSGWVRQVAVGDIEGDGDLDLFVPDGWGGAVLLFVNDGSGTFTDEASTRLDITTDAGSARFGDVDDDGDLDLLVGQWVAANGMRLFLNDGSGNFTEASNQLPTIPSTGGTDLIDMDLFDADGDFDLDLLINTHGNGGIFWLNDGAGTFTDASSDFPPESSIGFTYNPSACDVDGDGDLDVWYDNARNPLYEQLIINDGSAHFTDETTARVSGNVSVDDNGVICADIDNDGSLDAVVASLSGEERVLFNDGTGNFTASADSFPAVGDSTLWLDFGDVNGDGRLDAITGQGESGPFDNRLYLGNSSLPVDTVAPSFRMVEEITAVGIGVSPVFHFAVVDRAVTDIGPRLTSVTAVADGTPIDAAFMGGDLFRVELPAVNAEATVTLQACATDRQGNSACSPETTYLVTDNPPTPTPSPTPTPGPGGDGGGGACKCALGTKTQPHPLPLVGVLVLGGFLLWKRRWLDVLG